MAEGLRITVLGGGNGAFITAADLALKGHRITLCELPHLEKNIEGVLQTKEIELQVVGHPGMKPGLAHLDRAGTDVKEAVSGAEIILIVVPAFAQKPFAEACVPYLQDGQIVVLTPGNFGGAIEFTNILSQEGKGQRVLVAELECMIYSGFKSAPTVAWVSGYKKGLHLAAFPGIDTRKVMERMVRIYPDLRGARNVLETGLRNINTVVHAPIVVHNAGWIEKTQGKFLFYWDGCTPGVARSAEGVDRERMAIGKAFGLDLPSMLEVSLEWYGHEGAKGNTLYEVLSTNPVYVKDDAPSTLRHRFLLEDVPYGMVPVEVLGRLTGVPTPVTSAIATLSSEITGMNLRSQARDLNDLGLASLDREALIRLVDEGA